MAYYIVVQVGSPISNEFADPDKVGVSFYLNLQFSALPFVGRPPPENSDTA